MVDHDGLRFSPDKDKESITGFNRLVTIQVYCEQDTQSLSMTRLSYSFRIVEAHLSKAANVLGFNASSFELVPNCCATEHKKHQLLMEQTPLQQTKQGRSSLAYP